ncbi:MAG: 3-oxoacyl-[acyl-carrier-protein] reductase [Rickettsiaceae bacterium H1]|nr:3-oxoacyl-[acyl-carrier-protein] reductase [Rickettsiaceae bacterium H1]
MFDIKGKRILLTGATGGIGKAILEAANKLEAKVIISGTREQALSELREEFGVYIIKADLSDKNQIEDLVKNAQAKMGGIDILICNAGITDDKLILRMDDESWEKLIRINLTSTFMLNRNVAKIMLKQRYGRIINMSSVVAFTGNAGQANYVAAKAGMVGMTKSIALELASKNITANCIAPGFIATPMTARIREAQKENIIKNIPVGKIGEPKDIAAAAIFLMSDEAKYITGQTIHVNGGMYQA